MLGDAKLNRIVGHSQMFQIVATHGTPTLRINMVTNSPTTNSAPTHVCQASGNMIVVDTSDSQHDAMLHGFGFALQRVGSGRAFDLPVNSDKEKADVLSKLRDAGIAFSRGKEWCPAEVFEWLRDQGLTRGPFQSISWRGPRQWVVRQEP